MCKHPCLPYHSQRYRINIYKRKSCIVISPEHTHIDELIHIYTYYTLHIIHIFLLTFTDDIYKRHVVDTVLEFVAMF